MGATDRHDLLVKHHGPALPAAGAGGHGHRYGGAPGVLLGLGARARVKRLKLLRDVRRALRLARAGGGARVVSPEMIPERLGKRGPGVWKYENDITSRKELLF